MEKTPSKHHGLLALSPLLVFLCVYLVSSLVTHDFYRIPVSSAFLIASIYAMAISRGRTLEEKVTVFSKGAGDRNVMLMIWIFVMAGAFAATAKEIGAIEATVNVAMKILPGKLLYAGLFLASCFISMSIGTSVGTIVALVPIAAGIAEEMASGGATGFTASTPFITAIIVGGSFFGDNLSFISDTTIAATRTQECSMTDKFKVNLKIAGPAAIIVTILYMILGASVDLIPQSSPVEWILLIPYVLVIVLALSGVNVIAVLAIGIAVNGILGLAGGGLEWSGFLEAVGNGISGMGDLIIVTLLAGGMLELIRVNGGLDYIVSLMTRRIRGKRGAEFSIAALVSLANLCTANNTIAIITVGRIARDISQKFGIDPRKSASLLDTFSCLIQGIIPYGAQMLMAAGLAGISSISIIGYLYYPVILGLCAIVAIALRLPRKYS
ncbi:MAG: Na+/H+ antiporter NhaC family protein [Bacteroidales bacterium]|nr:Na+/H+ antiporter NhaC family protein [Bacteroidales bacterium]